MLDGTQTVTTTLGQSGLGSNDSEGYFTFPKAPDGLVSYPEHGMGVGILTLLQRSS